MASTCLNSLPRGASVVNTFSVEFLHNAIRSSVAPFPSFRTLNWHRCCSPPRPCNPTLKRAGLCFAASLPKDDKKDLLAGVDKGNVDAVVRILEQAKVAAERWEVAHSDFLTPPAMDDALKVLKRMADVGVVVSGGYTQAERCRLSVGHKEAILASSVKDGVGYPGAVAAISILGDFMFDAAAHSDFLGAILGTGIAREKVGDVLVQGNVGAQALIVPDLVDYLGTSLTQVRKTPVLCRLIPFTDLQIHPPRVKVVKSIEASLRVDALASAGFGMSRSRLVELISSGDVHVNWKDVIKNNLTVKTGDIISIRQKGRLEVGEISTTKKGKYAVELLRFL